MEDNLQVSDRLTERENEILVRLSTGLSDQQIADDLFLSLSTVKWYNRQIYSKLHVQNRTQAIARARALEQLPSDAKLRQRHNLPTQTTSFIGRERETRDHSLIREKLGPASLTPVCQVFIKDASLLMAQDAQRIKCCHLPQLIVGRRPVHRSPPSTGLSASRSFIMPSRVLVFTVPRGCPSCKAISLWLNPE